MTVILAIESSCDETGVGMARLDAERARSICWPTQWPPVSTSTPGSAGWCPRSPPAPTWRRWARPCAARWRSRVSSRPSMPWRPPSARAWPARCWSGWPRPRPTRRPGTCRSTASTTWPGTSPPTSRARAAAGVRRPAGLRRPHPAAARPVAGRADHAARQPPSTTPRARPTTRWPGCSGWATPAAR